jgi:transposase
MVFSVLLIKTLQTFEINEPAPAGFLSRVNLLDDYVSDANPVRVVDVFVDELDLVNLGFEGATPADTGRPAYHPAILL